MKVMWKNGSNCKIDAKVAYEEVESIRKKNNGEASADAVVKAATSKRNPLHPEFEWDNTVAGHEYRLEQARRMLRSLVILRDDIKSPRPQRVYEVVRSTDDVKVKGRDKKVYRSVDDIMADTDMRAELLHRALRELISIRDRYRDLQELAIVLRAIDETLETVDIA